MLTRCGRRAAIPWRHRTPIGCAAGRNGLTPTVCGTYDVVAMDGAAFIAKYDNLVICPGNGWQLLSRQGKRGHRGQREAAGPKGDKGPPVMPQLVSSKIDENYNLTILRSDDSLEIIPLRDAFERYHLETSG